MMTVESFTEGSREISFWPTSRWDTSTPVNQVTPGLGSGVDERAVAYTWVPGLDEYSARREAPRPRVAPTIRILDILK